MSACARVRVGACARVRAPKGVQVQRVGECGCVGVQIVRVRACECVGMSVGANCSRRARETFAAFVQLIVNDALRDGRRGLRRKVQEDGRELVLRGEAGGGS